MSEEHAGGGGCRGRDLRGVVVNGARMRITLEEKIKRTQDVARMYCAGMSLQAIGNKYGVSRETVRLWLVSVGVTRQDGGPYLLVRQRKEQARAEAQKRKESRPRYQARLKGMEYCGICKQERSREEMRCSDLRKCKRCDCAMQLAIRATATPRWTPKQLQIADLAAKHPEWLHYRIAREVGVVNSYVSQVLRRAKLAVRP